MKSVAHSLLVLAATLAMLVPAFAQQADPPRATAAPAAKATPAPKAKPQPGPLSAAILLTNGRELVGTLVDTTELPMRTSFGQANIPLSEVAGVKFAQEGNATTTVVLHNGDTLTGATDLPRLSIETEWGKAQINGPNMVSILFSQGLTWVSDKGLNGMRWKLAEKQPENVTPGRTVQGQPRSNQRGTVVRQFQ